MDFNTLLDERFCLKPMYLDRTDVLPNPAVERHTGSTHRQHTPTGSHRQLEHADSRRQGQVFPFASS